jgi:hypothetical protein
MRQLLDLARENATLRRELGRSQLERKTLQCVVAVIQETLANRTCPSGCALQGGQCVLEHVGAMLAQLLETE